MTHYLTLAAALSLGLTGAALAKGHAQSNTEVPGADVGAVTVGAAQTLGAAKGNRPDGKGPMTPGASADAGR